ncbi:MAG: hypothetical protein GXP61_03885 [Epsilonproteobacteria bacterium]|nr:hypothetical protein [Campylobacterota bacterium]
MSVNTVLESSLLEEKEIIYQTYHENKSIKNQIVKIGFQYYLKIYSQDGKLVGNAQITKDKKLHGEAISYYENGNIHCILYYINRQLHGFAQGFYYGGKKSLEILFQNNKAIKGAFFKKSGARFEMTKEQLKRKTEKTI